MQKLNFTININAPKEKVWENLWNDNSYRRWTSVFCEGAYFVGDLKEGSRVHFLTPEGRGLYSDVEKLVENEFISFKHIGEMKDNAETPLTDETKKWSGCHENYTLTETDGATILSVDVDALEQYLDFFNEKFPLALQNVKGLSETMANAA